MHLCSIWWCWDHLGEVFREFLDQILDDLLVRVSVWYTSQIYIVWQKSPAHCILPIENTKYAYRLTGLVQNVPRAYLAFIYQGWCAILFFAHYTVSEHLPYCTCNSMSQHTVFEVSDQIFPLFEGYSNKFIEFWETLAWIWS